MQSQKSTSDLDGMAALVTGAGRGLGAEIAGALAQRGAKVYALSRSANELEEVVLGIRHSGGQASALVCDVTDVDAFSAVVDRMDRLDALVNNAGTNFPTEFVDVTLDQLDAMLMLNVRSMFTIAQTCAQDDCGQDKQRLDYQHVVSDGPCGCHPSVGVLHNEACDRGAYKGNGVGACRLPY